MSVGTKMGTVKWGELGCVKTQGNRQDGRKHDFVYSTTLGISAGFARSNQSCGMTLLTIRSVVNLG